MHYALLPFFGGLSLNKNVVVVPNGCTMLSYTKSGSLVREMPSVAVPNGCTMLSYIYLFLY